jgi:sugar phosphate isomerase/epimerase
MTVGVKLSIGNNPDAAMAQVRSLDMRVCQIDAEYLDDDLVNQTRAAVEKYNIVVTALGTSGPGPDLYNFYDGPGTLGLVPRTYRAERIEKLKKFSDYCRELNIPAIRIHAGFVPEDPNDSLYHETVETFRDVIGYLKKNGQQFLYETGTETPVTLLRVIEDVGLDNQGINLDTANFVLYGKANPVDALEILGPHVTNTHMKDGLYPTNTHDLGKEAEIPHGAVDFPGIVAGLRKANYQGPLIIEREIHGPEWITSVARERDYLRKLVGS